MRHEQASGSASAPSSSVTAPQRRSGKLAKHGGPARGSGCSRWVVGGGTLPVATLRSWCGSRRAPAGGRSAGRSGDGSAGSDAPPGDANREAVPFARVLGELERELELPGSAGFPRRGAGSSSDAHGEARTTGGRRRSAARPDGLASLPSLGALDDAELRPGATSDSIASNTKGPSSRSAALTAAAAALRGQAHDGRARDRLVRSSMSCATNWVGPRHAGGSACTRVTLCTASSPVSPTVPRMEISASAFARRSPGAAPSWADRNVLPGPEEGIDQVGRSQCGRPAVRGLKALLLHSCAWL